MIRQAVSAPIALPLSEGLTSQRSQGAVLYSGLRFFSSSLRKGPLLLKSRYNSGIANSGAQSSPIGLLQRPWFESRSSEPKAASKKPAAQAHALRTYRGTLARKQSSPATALRMFGALGASASALLAAFGLISGFALLWAFPLALYAAYALLVSVKVALRLKSLSGLLSCFILPCLHAAYAGGLLFGLLCPRISGKGPVVIERYEGLQ